MTPEHILKFPPLPLARIKKVMKMDENVKMISGEVPLIFAKAAELFILELTLRSWVHTEENRRRTLQRNDVAHAVTEHDMFDFLMERVKIWQGFYFGNLAQKNCRARFRIESRSVFSQ